MIVNRNYRWCILGVFVSLSFFFLTNFMQVELLYNVLLASAVQQSESIAYIRIYTLF